MLMRATARLLAPLLLAMGVMAVVAAPAQAEPSHCSIVGPGDTYSGGSYYDGGDGGGTYTVVYGNWNNCSGPGDDHVRIDIDWSLDGPCTTVAYGTNVAYWNRMYQPFPVPAQSYLGWYRC